MPTDVPGTALKVSRGPSWRHDRSRRARPRMRAVQTMVVVPLLLAVLSGCVVTKNSFGPDHEGPVLTVWSYIVESESGSTLSTIDALFEKRRPDVQVRHVTVPLNELGPKLLSAAGTGEGPDVIIGNPVVDFSLLSQAGVYADITQRWKDYPDRKTFPDEALWRSNGRIYALHWRFNDLGLWYNKQILRELDIPVPHTVPDLQRAMAKVAATDKYRPIVFSGEPSVQATWQLISWMLGEGVNYCNLDSPRTTDVLQRVDRWVDRGYVARDAAALDPEDAFQKYLTGNYAFAIGGSWEVGQVAAAPPEFGAGTTRIPAGREGSHISFAGESIGVGAFSENKGLAWDYVRTSYLSQRAQLATFEAEGAIPTRKDTREHHRVRELQLARPFIEALEPSQLRPWPDNPNTLDAQTEVGTVYSSMLAGDLEPEEAAAQMRTRVREAFEEGGGGC